MYAKLKKCEFWLDKVFSLGYVLTKGDILVDPRKIDVVANWRRPCTMTAIQSFFLDLLVIIGGLLRGSLRSPYL